uniref:G-protein coupled receptors family 1 profile domain-containing protein n=1 Tax=Meloidogyne enterolobii TaxID=390850 RepID=A0A6V7VVZ7_MELEN|nr:unnamed protein product [Meloidogyne enterolobii]
MNNNNNISLQFIQTSTPKYFSYQKNILEQLDSSLFINLIRYGIAANAIGTNAFILYLFIRFRSLRSTQCNLFIAANAAVELIIGFGTALRGSFQLYVLANSIMKFSHSLCVWIGAPLTGGFAANQITILMLALDRLAAVARPLKYGNKNKSLVFGSLFLSVAVFVGAIWLSLWGIDDSQSSSTQCSMGINAGPLFSVIWSLFAQSSTLLVFGLYISMLIMFYMQTGKLNVYSRHKYSICSVNLWSMPRSESQQLNIQQRQQRRLTISVALILLLYTISWALPTAIWFAFNILDHEDRTRINYVTFLQGFLTPFGAGINLYIYLWKHAEIRNSAVSTIPWLKNILREEMINPVPSSLLKRSGSSLGVERNQSDNRRTFEMRFSFTARSSKIRTPFLTNTQQNTSLILKGNSSQFDNTNNENER